MLEDDLGTVDVCLDGMDRLFDNQLHADCSRKMKNDITTVDELGQQPFVRDGVNGVLKGRQFLEMFDVLNRAGREVVENVHAVPLLE